MENFYSLKKYHNEIQRINALIVTLLHKPEEEPSEGKCMAKRMFVSSIVFFNTEQNFLFSSTIFYENYTIKREEQTRLLNIHQTSGRGDSHTNKE